MWPPGSYSKHFMFFITHEWDQSTRVIVTKTFSVDYNVTLRLIGPNLKVRKKLRVVNMVSGPYSQHFMFFITHEWA
jgi:hypothetical protein